MTALPSVSAHRWFVDPWRGANAGRHLLAGLVVGVGTPGLILILLGSGGFQGVAWRGVALPGLLAAILTGALLGPLLLRYLAQRGLELLVGPVAAAGITALGFGLLHLTGGGLTGIEAGTPLGGLAATAAGLMFGTAYLATRTIWLPLAIHIGWSLVSVVLAGPPQPGAHRLFLLTPQGHAAISGGASGPGASVLTILNCLAIAAAFLFAAVRGSAAPVCARIEADRTFTFHLGGTP
jgi:membrane protease YdiL (CAAX protease family)